MLNKRDARGTGERDQERACCVLLALYLYINCQLSLVCFFSLSAQHLLSVYSVLIIPSHPSTHPYYRCSQAPFGRETNQISADASAPRPISRATPPSEALLAPALSLPARLSQSPPFSPLILLIFFLLFFLIVFLLFHPQPSTDRCCYVWGQGPSLSCPAVLQDPSTTTTARFYQSCILQH